MTELTISGGVEPAKLPQIEWGNVYSPGEKIILLEEQLRAEKMKVQNLEKELLSKCDLAETLRIEKKTLMADFVLLTETLKTTKEALSKAQGRERDLWSDIEHLRMQIDVKEGELVKANSLLFRLISRVFELEDSVKELTQGG